MEAEYFPPREDVILQNEAPTDVYILVTGALVKPLCPKQVTHPGVHERPSKVMTGFSFFLIFFAGHDNTHKWA